MVKERKSREYIESPSVEDRRARHVEQHSTTLARWLESKAALRHELVALAPPHAAKATLLVLASRGSILESFRLCG